MTTEAPSKPLVTLSSGKVPQVGRAITAPFRVYWRGREVANYGNDESRAEAMYCVLLRRHRRLNGNTDRRTFMEAAMNTGIALAASQQLTA